MRAGLRFLFLAVPVLWVAVAHIGPLLAMATISFLNIYPEPPDAAPAFGIAAYTMFLHEAGYRASLWRSLGLAAAVSLAALVLTYPLACHVALRVAPERKRFRLLLLVAPFWSCEVLRMFALVLLLANRGALNGLLRLTGLASGPVALLYGNGAVMAGMLYSVLLCMLLPLYAGLDGLPPVLLNAAATFGARPWRRFWQVILPLSARGVASGGLLTFLACLGVFAAPALLGGPATPVFATTIADLFAAASGRWPIGAAFGFILLAAGTAGAAVLAGLPGVLLSRRGQPRWRW